MDPDGNVEVWDFTIPDLPKRFKIDNSGEVFEAPPVLGGKQLVRLARGARELGKLISSTEEGAEEALMAGMDSLFTTILTEESGPAFVARLDDGKRPVDIKRQVIPILFKLMEAYGLRPTQPSTDSSSTSTGTDAGTSSTDGAPPAESTPST